MHKFTSIYIAFVIILTACGVTPTGKIETKADTINISASNHLLPQLDSVNRETEEMSNDDMATYFVIVADTSLNYFALHKKMFSLNRKFKLPIDTMGRFYNTSKNLIALPDNADDEIYAGNYFPRRFPSEDLSIEYLNFYQKQASLKTMALVTGIYENEKSADSSLVALQKTEKKTFKIKADIYIGCMH